MHDYNSTRIHVKKKKMNESLKNTQVRQNQLLSTFVLLPFFIFISSCFAHLFVGVCGPLKF